MTLGIRKLLVIVLIVGLIGLANVWAVVTWLDRTGAIGWAQHARSEYLTGTAVTIIVVLLILLVGPGGHMPSIWQRKCSVCGERVGLSGSYCSGCGSKV